MTKKVVLFVSRNKDNVNVEGFKSRKYAFLADIDQHNLKETFRRFVDDGVMGEASRFYVSVNTPDMGKVKKALLTKLINEDDVDLTNLNRIVTSLSAKEENALDHNWLFDIDTVNPVTIAEILNDLMFAIKTSLGDSYDPVTHKTYYTDTPNGFAYVTTFHFDARSVLAKWGDVVTLKKGAFLFMDMKVKGEEEEDEVEKVGDDETDE